MWWPSAHGIADGLLYNPTLATKVFKNTTATLKDIRNNRTLKILFYIKSENKSAARKPLTTSEVGVKPTAIVLGTTHNPSLLENLIYTERGSGLWKSREYSYLY